MFECVCVIFCGGLCVCVFFVVCNEYFVVFVVLCGNLVVLL